MAEFPEQLFSAVQTEVRTSPVYWRAQVEPRWSEHLSLNQCVHAEWLRGGNSP